ncbi:DUF559 domain-containing protein [Plantibacter flavus]|uniref:DUF559 domain-containing protein n=1 Tax=Plantibacter flavus TaxID=150123 RepID=UPI003F183444
MDLISWLERRDGIAERREAIELGATRSQIDSTLRDGAIRLIRRRWLATSSAPADLTVAATHGGRLTCLSAAARLGLWTLGDGLIHLSVRASSSEPCPPRVKRHWMNTPSGTVGRRLIEPVETALIHLAACQPFESALVVLESALRGGLVDREHLLRLETRSTRFRAVVNECTGLADSGIETIPRIRLRRLGIDMRQQVVIDGHRVDGMIGRRLVLQFDGHAPHQQVEQRSRDLRQDRRLLLLGYTVLRFSYQQVMYDWDHTERAIIAAIAHGKHR